MFCFYIVIFLACQAERSSTEKEEEPQEVTIKLDFSNTQKFVEALSQLKPIQITTTLLDSIVQKSKQQERLGAMDSIFFFDSLLLKTAKRANQLDYIAKGQAYLAYDHREANLWDSAYHYYNLAQKTYKLLGDSLQVGRKLLEMGKIQQKQAAYFESKETVTEALPYLDSINDAHYWGVMHNVLGHNYKNLDDYTMAEKFYQRAIASETNRNIQILYVNNLGLLYREMGDTDKAIKLFGKALQELPEDFDATEKARLQHNLAYSEWKLNQKKPVQVFLKVLKTRKAHQDYWGLLSSYYSLFEFHLPKAPKLAEKYADTLVRLSKKLKNPNSEIEVLSKLLTHNPQKYAYLSPRYIHLRDSLEHRRSAFKNQYAYLKYQDQQDKARLLALEAETAQNEAELAKAQAEKIFMLSLIAIILLGEGAFYLILRQRHKKKRLEEIHAAENRISSEIHDGVANTLFGIMVQFQNDTIKTKEILKDLQNTYNHVRNLSHRLAPIDIGKEFKNELVGLAERFTTERLNVILMGHENVNWEKIKKEKSILLYRTIRELLVNQEKHSGASLVCLNFKEISNRLNVTYTDNGKGLKNENQKGTGLNSIENNLKKVKGHMVIDNSSNNGLTINFFIPI